MRRSRHGVTDDDGISTERLQRLHGINKRLALLDAAPLHVAPDDIRPGALRRKLEGDLRPGARLIEQGDDGPSSQPAGRSFPIGIGLGRVEQLLDLSQGKLSQSEQVSPNDEPPREGGRRKRQQENTREGILAKEEGRRSKLPRPKCRVDLLPSSLFPLPVCMAFPASPGRFKGQDAQPESSIIRGKKEEG